MELNQKSKESEELYQLLFNNSLNCLALYEKIYDDQGKTIDYRFLTVNPTFKRLVEIPDPKFGALSADSFGWRLVKDGRIECYVKWEIVKNVTAFKKDLLTTDLICLEFEDIEGNFWLIHEEIIGFMDVAEKLKEQFPSINESWYTDVMMPPFERNHTILYEKKADA